MTRTEFIRLQQMVASTTYKPGVTLQVVLSEDVLPPSFFIEPLLQVTARVDDVTCPGNKVSLTLVRAFPDPSNMIYDEKYFLTFVRCVLEELEQHELDEWIHFRGKRPYDPHRNH